MSGIEAVASLAGATSEPLALPVPTRRGGFGGASGLAAYLRQERIDLLIDATHPFAAQISANAADGCGASRHPKTDLTAARPGARREGDRWIEVDTVEAAAEALGAAPLPRFLDPWPARPRAVPRPAAACLRDARSRCA